MGRLMRPPSPRVLAGAALAFGVTVLGGCVPQPATSEGVQVKGLYDVFLIAAAAVFLIVAGLIGWSVLRYRAGDDDEELPPQVKANVRLELIWWALPTILVIVLFFLTAQVLSRVDARNADPSVEVTVTGYQWQWRFAYAGTDVVIEGLPDQPPELWLPTGEPVALTLVSPDVIHSFWVPDFLVKRDVVPGRTNRIDLTIDEAGTYSGQCAEFCGLLHDRMLFSIRAVSPAEFEAWLAGQGGGS